MVPPRGHPLRKTGHPLPWHGHPGNNIPPPMIEFTRHDLAKTVYFCHCLGVIHGNLTPSNIVLTADRGPKITGFDFSCGYSELECKNGLVRAPTSSSFIPPEQGVTSVRDIGPAKDISALGAIAYYLITWQSWSP